jgi:hypothetical protein
MTIYIVIEHDDMFDEGFPFLNLEEYLDDFNEQMGTEYRTAGQFNEGEEFRTIYKINTDRL